MNKTALLLKEIKREMHEAVEEIGAYNSNPLFGKFLKPIQKFFNSFGRKVFVLLEVQNSDIDTLKETVTRLERQLENKAGKAA